MAAFSFVSELRTILLSSAVLLPLSAAGQTVDYLALQETIGEPVTMSVTGKPQRASELPASTIIITRDEIARSPARDIPGILKTYAGVDVNRWTAGQSDVAVRGGVQTYNARLLVLVDGRQVYLDHYGMTNWNLLGVQLEEIQQIELVRGSSSALYGFNAASGVVNIITRRVTDQVAATALGEVGNHGSGKVTGSLLLPVSPSIGVRLAGAHVREDERRIPTELLRPAIVQDVQSDQIAADVTGSFGTLNVNVGGGHATNRQMEYLPSQLLSNQHFNSDNVHLSATQDTVWGGITANAYVNWLDASYGIGTSTASSDPIILKNRIMVGQASALIRLDSVNTLRLGGEYRNNLLRSFNLFSRTISYDVGSLNAMLDLHPTDLTSVSLAGRLDRLSLNQSGAIVQPAYSDASAFDRSFTRFSFNAAFLLRTDANGTLRINGGHSYQLPSLVNFGSRIPIVTPSPVPVFVAGSPTIDPVGVWSAEIGHRRSLGGVQLEATAFVTRTEDAIASPGDGLQTELFLTPFPSLVARFKDVGNYTTYGVEAAASGKISALTWRVNYTWTHTDEQLTPVTPPIPFALSPQSTTPVHKANVVLGYDVRRWALTGVARYTSSTRQLAFSAAPQLLLYRVDDAVAFDARAAFHVTPIVDVFALGENLILADGAAVSPIPGDRRVRLGMRVAL